MTLPVRQRPAFRWHHIVPFVETNVVGNVYFSHHVAWQGYTREMFLREHAPTVIDELAGDLRLVTLRTACEYFQELAVFDEIEIAMRLESLDRNRINLVFEYHRLSPHPGLVAEGGQSLVCMRLGTNGLVPTEPPTELAAALAAYQ